MALIFDEDVSIMAEKPDGRPMNGGISRRHVERIAAVFADRTEPFVATVSWPWTGPERLPALMCDLYGPSLGDAPVRSASLHTTARELMTGEYAFCAVLPGHSEASRCVVRPQRPTWAAVVFATRATWSDDPPGTLRVMMVVPGAWRPHAYWRTADYLAGGPSFREFWQTHAIAVESVPVWKRLRVAKSKLWKGELWKGGGDRG